MFRALLAASLVFGFPVLASSDEYVFAGFSTNTTDGSAGYTGMNGICQIDFDEDARFANTKEFIEASNTSNPDAPGAWINPFIVAGGSSNSRYDFSGAQAENCMGWSVNILTVGMVVLEGGGIALQAPDDVLQFCNIPRFVACSEPD